MKFKQIGFFALAAALGCVHPSVIITGITRPHISESNVKIFLEEPKEQYELVGRVDVEVEEGFSQQGDLDKAIKSAISEAAKVGANGVIILQRGNKSSGGVMVPVGNMWMAAESSNTTISAKMIYIKANQ